MANLSETHSATLTIGTEADARRAVDALTESLWETDVAVAAFEQPNGQWDVTLHFGEPPDREALASLVTQSAGAAVAASLQFETVAAQDWVKSSLQGLGLVSAGRFVVHGGHDRYRVAPNQLGIEIEAGLAFGTGHHATTRGCLLLLDEVLRAAQPRRVLDLGNGTGVLAIAAAKALRRHIFASDIDARSVMVARDNARLNGVGNLIQFVCASGFAAAGFAAHAPFDLVMANILANPLKGLARPMRSHLAHGGLAILSGLLRHQAAGVIAIYRAKGFVLLRRLELDGWSSLLMARID